MDEFQEIKNVVFATSFLLIVIGVFFLLFFQAYKRRLVNNIKKISQLNEEILRSQLEIQEQTLKNISQEIHDNIGQLLSLTKLNLATADIEQKETARQKIDNSHQLVSKAIVDLRNLSRSLDTDHISEKGLEASIAFELELIEKTGKHKTEFKVEGNVVKPDKQKELILFRIVQECFNNIIKHADANAIKVFMVYGADSVSITITDNGKGFNMEISETGLGLRNMSNRAKLIGAEFSINSIPGDGTRIGILLPI